MAAHRSIGRADVKHTFSIELQHLDRSPSHRSQADDAESIWGPGEVGTPMMLTGIEQQYRFP